MHEFRFLGSISRGRGSWNENVLGQRLLDAFGDKDWRMPRLLFPVDPEMSWRSLAE